MLAERGQLMQGVVSDLGDRDAHLLALRPTIGSPRIRQSEIDLDGNVSLSV